MWQCPKCGRKFENENQQHYCGESPKTVEAYIAEHPLSIQEYLNQLRKPYWTHYRMLRSVSHGACQPIGTSIIYFILLHSKTILAFILGQRL